MDYDKDGIGYWFSLSVMAEEEIRRKFRNQKLKTADITLRTNLENTSGQWVTWMCKWIWWHQTYITVIHMLKRRTCSYLQGLVKKKINLTEENVKARTVPFPIRTDLATVIRLLQAKME